MADSSMWQVEQWLNSPTPVTLESLRGRVVYVLAFQMLCPGCATEAIPQALRVRQSFADRDVAVIGLHTVFEHHEAQGSAAALKAFLHEYRVGFPVGIDSHGPQLGMPRTMEHYQMRGTPTELLFDREGELRLQHFGHLDDMRLGASIATLLAEPAPELTAAVSSNSASA